ncbi:MAG: hypothetical protein JJE52_01715 [Acidimicrobiia bacterium]|nr:hypothetical protein [Acidimicrobiia bacterium]
MSTIEDGMLRGPARRPINAHQEAPNSIHNDEVAGSLGFRGGTVAGSIHMDQFPPLLVQAFGQRWFETGSLSLQFRNATTSGEEVSPLLGDPGASDDVQVPARMLRDDGLLVAEGTASIGNPSEQSHLHSIDLRPSDPSELKMFPHLAIGEVIMEHEGSVASADAIGRADKGLITEPMGWYLGDSPWGGPIAGPSQVIGLLWRRTTGVLTASTGGAVGLFGAIEVRHLNGPVMADTTYQVESRVVAPGASPKTEYVWFDSTASDDTGTPIATMRMQLRWMKASSSLFS